MSTLLTGTRIRTITALLAAAASAVLIFPTGAMAVPPYDPDDPGSSNSPPPPDIPTYPTMTADASIVINRYNGAMLGGRNVDQLMAPASTTKLMTGLLAVEAIEDGWISQNSTVTIQSDVGVEGGGQVGLRPGDTISVRDLLYLTLVSSKNDAATALGTYVAGSRHSFIGAMNQRANELGLDDTSYVDISGTDPGDFIPDCEESPGRDTEPDFNVPWCAHFSTARDLASLARTALDHPLFAQVVATQSTSTTTWRRPSPNRIRVQDVSVNTTNSLLSSFAGAYGVKTGSTYLAGENLVSAARRSSGDVIAVVLHSDTNQRFADSTRLLNYGLDF